MVLEGGWRYAFHWPEFFMLIFYQFRPHVHRGSRLRIEEERREQAPLGDLAPHPGLLLLCELGQVAYEQLKDRVVFPVSIFPASSKEPAALCALNKCLLDDQTRECTLWSSEKYTASPY